MLKGRKIQKKKNKTKEEDVSEEKFWGEENSKKSKKKRVKEIQIKKDTKFSIKVRYV